MKISPILINTPKIYSQKAFKGNEQSNIEYSDVKKFNPRFNRHIDPRVDTLTRSAKIEANKIKTQADITQKIAQSAVDDLPIIKKQGKYYIKHANEIIEFYTNLTQLAHKQGLEELMFADGKHFFFEKDEEGINITLEKDDNELMYVSFLTDGGVEIEYPNPDDPESSNIYIQKDGETYTKIGVKETGDETFTINEMYKFDPQDNLEEFSRNVTDTPDAKSLHEEKYEFDNNLLSCFISNYSEESGCMIMPRVFYFDENENFDMSTSDSIMDSRGLTKIGTSMDFSENGRTVYISPSSSIIFENGKLSMYTKYKNNTGLDENPQVQYEIDFSEGYFADRV